MKKKKGFSFEETLARLANIVETVENGQTPLDDAITLYKEGLALAADCGEVLNRYEAEILTLKKNADETFTLKPFASDQITGVS